MGRYLKVLLAGALAAGALTGCSGKEAAFKPAKDTKAAAAVEIVGKLDNFEALESVIQDFNKVYPNVTISYSKMDDYVKTMGQVIASPDAPELFLSLRSYFQDNPDWLAAAADLSGLDLDTDIVEPGVLNSCLVDDKLVRVPLMLNYQGIAVNKTLLKDNGLAVPDTYEDFLKACTALKDKGYTPLQGYPDSFYSGLLFNEWRVRLAKAADSAEIFKELNAGAEGSGKYLLDSFRILEDYRSRGYYSEADNAGIANGYDEAIMRFFEGDVPFLVCSAETLSGMAKRESKSEAYTANPFDYGFYELPVSAAGASAVVDVWYGLSVDQNADDADWGREFIRFLFTRKELNQMAKVKGLPTAVKGGSDDERYANLITLSDEQKIYIGNVSVSATLNKVFVQCAKQIGSGELTAAAAAGEFPALMRQALGK